MKIDTSTLEYPAQWPSDTPSSGQKGTVTFSRAREEKVSEVMSSGHDRMNRVSVIDFQPFPAWYLQLVRIKTQLM